MAIRRKAQVAERPSSAHLHGLRLPRVHDALLGVAVGAVAWLGGASGPVAAGIAVLVALLLAAAGRVPSPPRPPRPRRAERERQAADAERLALEQAYERARSVLEALREGVVVVAGTGEVVMANPAARRAMLDPHAEPAGKVLWELLPAEMATRAHEAWLALQQREGDHPEALPQIRYSAIPCRDSIYDLTAVEALSSRTGQDFGSVFLLVDATHSHELQRLKDRFLSSVSHELRTPLTNICAYSEILHSMLPGESAEWPEFVRVIHEEGLQLSRLVDGMFDFLQLESGEAPFAQEELDGAAIVRGVCRQFQASTGERRIAVDLLETSPPPRVVGDRARLEQVCRHLIDNAVKFTPPQGQVRITLGGHDEGWELRVEDSGPGVPPSDRRAVFEKFHQLHDHLTEKPSGTGIGLATCRAIVARFGGLIWCEDSPLGGACFVVKLPGAGQPRLAAAGSAHGGGF